MSFTLLDILINNKSPPINQRLKGKMQILGPYYMKIFSLMIFNVNGI